MEDNKERIITIQTLAGDGKAAELIELLETGHTKNEINAALETAIAYSQIEIAEYLLSLGADISYHDYDGAYYAAHNNELKGLQFAIENSVPIKVNNGMLLNTAIETAINTKSTEMVSWLKDKGANLELLTTQTINSMQKYGSKELNNLIKDRWLEIK